MTQQLRVAGALSVAALMVLGLPLAILLMLDPSSQAACSGTPTGPGPASVPGIPQNLLPIFEGAGQQFQLGNNGWAYLAALNYAESTFGTSQLPGVHSESNSAGAAGPMQIGIGGAATDNWDTIVAQIPAGLSGGAQPPSVYNETDAIYGAAVLLHKWGAPANWQAALVAWNNYPPEIAQVTQLVAQYTNTSQGPTGAPAAGASTTPVPAGGQGCVPVSGPTTPGAVARVLPNGLAAIPQGAPPTVQEMIAAGNQIIGYPYSYGGGHSPASMRVPPGPNADPGQQENGSPGYDCSSSVSFVLWGAGLGQSLLGGQVDDSSTLQNVGRPGTGQWVTIYAGTSGGQGHTFIEVAGIVLDTVRLRHEPGRHRPALAARLRDRPRARQRLIRHPTPPRTMTRPRFLLALAACLLGLAGCGGSHTATSPTTSTAARRASITTSQVAHEAAAAAQFAAAYVRFLDGAGTAGGLPDATLSARALAGRAGSIPGTRRHGTLVMTQLHPAVGAPAATC